MPKQKACKKCKAIYTTAKCPRCGGEEGKDNYKGRIRVLSPEQSEIAKRLNLKDKGDYAIRV